MTPGRIVRYEAPDPVGRFPGSYIPLREGNYTLVTKEDRIVANVTLEVNDIILQSNLRVKVTYGGQPLPNANVTVTQSGTFTGKTYQAQTDKNGEATIAVVSNVPEINELYVTVAKDDYNFTEQTFSVVVGVSWILTALIVTVIVTLLVFFAVRRHRKRRR
jgi:membrane protein insertase Oxa1/YidC/SpoIIIJ